MAAKTFEQVLDNSGKPILCQPGHSGTSNLPAIHERFAAVPVMTATDIERLCRPLRPRTAAPARFDPRAYLDLDLIITRRSSTVSSPSSLGLRVGRRFPQKCEKLASPSSAPKPTP
ncbi:MAG: hypothetical protein ACLSHC_15025 [Bilophila wadsworthia]